MATTVGKKLTIDGYEFDLSGDPDYAEALNKPSINNVVLTGNKDFEDLGIEPIPTEDIMNIIES